MMKTLHKLFSLIALTLLTVTTLQVNSQFRPNIYFDPATLEASVGMNDSVVVHSVLHNGSDYTVDFSFPGYTSKGQGGPDSYGYTWIDSEEPGGPEWSYTDISETGTLVEGLGDDQMAGPFELGFNFHYYGETHNQFWISSNGVISFNNQMIPFYNQPIPTNNNYMDFIAWFWDDLMIDTSISRVYIKSFEEKTVVQFTKMVHFPGSESFITGQVIMMANGSILLKYRIVSESFETAGATVGLQSWNSQQGLQVVHNAEYVHSELAVRFDLNTNFITHVQPATLTLLPNTQETIWITYSSEGFEAGNYEQDLKCLTSHPELPYILLHNVMHVVNQDAAGFKGYVTDAVTGFAMNDVLVQAGEQQAYTNDNGYYELPVEQGSFNVHFTRAGYQSVIIEDTTSMPGYSILSVTMQPNDPTYFLVGRVYAGDNFLETGFAYGYKMIEDEVVDVYAEMVGQEGWYEFSGLAPADYIVKAEPSPSSIYYGTYLPTYYGDVLHWEDATPIVLNQNTDGAHIHLIAEVSAPTGPGSISGTIENSGRTAEVAIILRTIDPGAAIMTLSNTDGSFAFNDLAYGTYEIFAEIPGKSITPMTIDLNETTPSYENADMLVTANEIVFTGIEESQIFETMPYLYPNPVKENLNIMFNLKKPAQVAISIFDCNGRKVFAESHAVKSQQNITLSLDNLANGIYVIRIDAVDEHFTARLVKR